MNNNLFNILFIFIVLLGFIAAISALILIYQLTCKIFNKKTGFPKKSFIAFIAAVAFICVYFLNLYTNLDFLPKGEFNREVNSPKGDYSIRTYHYGATNAYYARMSRAELVNKSNGDVKTIYFNEYDYDPLVEWADYENVRIGRISFNIKNINYFDFRKQKLSTTELAPQS
jgi:hypothetical protein